VRFPLADWIDDHADVRHNLAQSGLKGVLPALEATLARPEEGDPEALSRKLAAIIAVPSERLFLTHGASEGNALVLVFLARHLAGSRRAPIRFTTPVPEYPPLGDAAEWAGLRRAGRGEAAEVVACSDPNNPTGLRLEENPAISPALQHAKAILVDETFREFTTARSRAAEGDPKFWVTGTFTKVYGADRIRVGFVVAPEPSTEEFASFHGVMTDEIAPASVGAALAILRDREGLLAEARRRLARNLAALRAAIPEVPELKGPVHFDRGAGDLDGDRFAEFALEAGVLVCPGSYFGDPTGVRICLTSPAFPEALPAYLAAREKWLNGGRLRASPTTSPRASSRPRGGP
jgi:aspartate/methionine/tyrosine aminotransferase